MQMSAVVCYFAVHECFLIFQNFRLWDLSISIEVHFLDEVKSLLTAGEQKYQCICYQIILERKEALTAD